MQVPRFPFRRTVCGGLLLISAVTPLTAERVHADDARRSVTDEKAKSISAAMEASVAGLPQLYASVSRSIVRVETEKNDNLTGVIVSTDGHLLVGNGFSVVNGSGSIDVKVHLSDGRTVTATAAGWSLEWRLAVMKINAAGPWPAIEVGSTRELKAGEPCLVIGYPLRGDLQYDVSPAARWGFIDRSVPARWLTTTCFPGSFEYPVVVGMDGRLLGVVSGKTHATAVDVFVAHRDDLFAGKNLDWVRFPPPPDSIYHTGVGDHPELLRMRKTDDVLGKARPPRRMSDAQLSKVRQIAKQATVRLVSKDQRTYDGEADARWSGVIVSEDGYILTCGHACQLPGDRFTVRLSDGRDVEGVALGSNPITDIGLVKITTPGPWPCAEIAASSTLKPGDPLVVAGYPAVDPQGNWTTERLPQIDTTAVGHPLYLLWYREINNRLDYLGQGGMSGGGVFNEQGCYVAVYNGSGHTRSEVARLQWDDLQRIESIDTATGLPHPLRKRFVTPGQAVAQSVVELLVDSRPVGSGTIVNADGWILTKASVLDGKVRCRLPDQSVVVAEKRAESQAHDLALLKIDVGDLTAAEFSDQGPPAVARLLCAVGPRPLLKPGIVSVETRAIPPEPRWQGGAIEETPDGVKLSRAMDLHLRGTKLRRGDIIVSLKGHATPDVAALTHVLETNLGGYCTGDLVSVALRRKGKAMNVLTTLPPATGAAAAGAKYWMMDDARDTPRRSGFAAVFDTDIALPQREVGCPVIDEAGRICGIAIISRGRVGSRRGPTSVLPSHIVKRVIAQLMTEATSR